MQYNYDEQGVTFYYFLLTFIAIFLIPTTILLFVKSEKEKDSRKPNCSCEACQRKEKLQELLKPKSPTKRLSKTAVAVGLGWILVAYLTYRISTIHIEVEVWDPYEVLEISEGASPDTIKKVFKKLSLQWHPDKAPDDKKVEHGIKFIDITKAYKVLTNDEVRKNYEEYGHPDGKQAYKVGIALPKWVVESKNSIFVLGIYGILFGILLPYFVGRWWYNSNGYTKNKIRTHTMALYFKELRDKSSVKHILELISASFEFLELVEQRPSDAAALAPVLSSIKEELDRRFGEKFEKSKRFNAPYCVKASALLYAHLLRINIDDKSLLRDQAFIVERSAHLLNGMSEISLAHEWLVPTMHCMELQQLLVQAVWTGENPLVQLPNINHEVLKAMKSKKRNIKSVLQLREMSEEDRRSALRTLTDPQYEDVKRIADSYPTLEIVRAYFKVTGDDIVTPKSLVSFTLRLRLVESTVSKVIEDSTKSGEKTVNITKTNQQKSSKNSTTSNGCDSSEDDDEKQNFLKKRNELQQNELVHAPYFPLDKRPYWYIFIVDEKNNKVVVSPIRITGIVERTVRVQFQAPPLPGLFSFIVYIKSDSYVGGDVKKDIKLEVKEPSELPPEDPIDDTISDPEEDSIAGQMKIMREQGLSAAVAGGTEKKNADDSDSSDSD